LSNASDAAVREHFRRMFHREPDRVVSAPGRVNLIGEHTDYNGGYVLPMAIPQRTWAAVSHARHCHVRASSRNLGGGDRIREFRVGGEVVTKGWIDYVQGVTQVLTRDGHALGGFDLAIVSDVPLGSGLSSSAALEVAVLRALRDLFGLAVDDVRLAQLGQRAENDFVGAPVGVMDQMAASLADERTALFLDTRTLQYEQVPLPPGGGLVVINSGVAHNHASGDYRTRRAECERAAAALGMPQLRDLGSADLPRVAALPDPLARRARHVVTENERVLESVAAMKAGDLSRLGELFTASHASQRDDFEVSVLEIDLLVDLAHAERGVFGARLTGGGFGGSIVALVEAGADAEIGQRVARAYRERSGQTPTVLVPQSQAGL
jgi:galactokinase